MVLENTLKLFIENNIKDTNAIISYDLNTKNKSKNNLYKIKEKYQNETKSSFNFLYFYFFRRSKFLFSRVKHIASPQTNVRIPINASLFTYFQKYILNK